MIGDSIEEVVRFVDSAKGELGIDLFTGEAREPIHYAKKKGSYWLALESSDLYFNQGNEQDPFIGLNDVISTTASVAQSNVQDRVMAVPVSYEHYIQPRLLEPPPGAIDFQLLAQEPRLKGRFSEITATFPFKDTIRCLNTLEFNQQIYAFLKQGGRFAVTADLHREDLDKRGNENVEFKFPDLMSEAGFEVEERDYIAGMIPSAFGKWKKFQIVYQAIGKK